MDDVAKAIHRTYYALDSELEDQLRLLSSPMTDAGTRHRVKRTYTLLMCVKMAAAACSEVEEVGEKTGLPAPSMGEAIDILVRNQKVSPEYLPSGLRALADYIESEYLDDLESGDE